MGRIWVCFTAFISLILGISELPVSEPLNQYFLKGLTLRLTYFPSKIILWYRYHINGQEGAVDTVVVAIAEFNCKIPSLTCVGSDFYKKVISRHDLHSSIV